MIFIFVIKWYSILLNLIIQRSYSTIRQSRSETVISLSHPISVLIPAPHARGARHQLLADLRDFVPLLQASGARGRLVEESSLPRQ